MPLNNRYPIVPIHAPLGSRRRPGRPISPRVRFIVAHDTGNPGASAQGHARWYRNDPNPPLSTVSSAHLFVDDRQIVETIPAFEAAEQALHVLRNKPRDNELYGVDANRAAIGVEYCYGGNIDADEAYARYVWLLAALCATYGLDPSRDIVGHSVLDPGRKSDPGKGLSVSGRSYAGLLRDVVGAFRANGAPVEAIGKNRTRPGTVATTVNLRRRDAPNLSGRTLAVLSPGTVLEAREVVKGESVSGNDDWCELDAGYCWSGGVRQLSLETVSAAPLLSPGFAARAADAAEAEWTFFGRQTYDELGRTTNLGHKEDEAPAYWNRIRDYWVEGTNTRGIDGRDTESFWSATFISWLMRKAGAETRFRYSIKHSVYISQAIRDLKQKRAEAGYWCYRLEEAKPEVGDLICLTREAGVTYDAQKGGDYKGHCDLVVEVKDGHAYVIGGNIGNSVTRRPFALDSDGHLRPADKLFGLMKCRLG